jgi:serpin B
MVTTGGNMKPRALVALLVATVLVMTACTDSTESTTVPDVAALAMSDLARASASSSNAEIAAAAAGLELFGADLYGVLAAGDGNLVVSPASIILALAMTYAGAEGVTAEEMATALHFRLDDESLHEAFNALDALVESRSFEGPEDDGVLVSTANSLWGQQGLPFEKAFLDTLAVNYGAGMRLVDFTTAAEDARLAINEWVAGETNDKITDLIPAGMLNALTRLVLVNAVYLDATWASQFDPENTSDGSFFLTDGAEVTVPLMTQSASFSFGTGPGWRAVQLPYLRNELGMLLIVPDEGRFSEIEATLDSGLIARVAEGLARIEVALTMPKFEFRTQTGLNPALRELGMATAFDGGTADFSGMTTAERLFISDIIHEAYIAVDEEGTEAAAATAVVMGATAAPLESVQLTIDRPFLFALRDLETGALLFLGRVMDPSS